MVYFCLLISHTVLHITCYQNNLYIIKISLDKNSFLDCSSNVYVSLLLSPPPHWFLTSISQVVCSILNTPKGGFIFLLYLMTTNQETHKMQFPPLIFALEKSCHFRLIRGGVNQITENDII